MDYVLPRCSLKIEVNESEFATNKCSFLDYFFFYRSLKLVHLHLFWPRLQYIWSNTHAILTYLCIHCSQSFILEHYFVGTSFERYISRAATKGFFQALYWQTQVLLNISVANVKFDFETYQKIQSKVKKKQMVFMQDFRGKRLMGHALRGCSSKAKVK